MKEFLVEVAFWDSWKGDITFKYYHVKATDRNDAIRVCKESHDVDDAESFTVYVPAELVSY